MSKIQISHQGKKNGKKICLNFQERDLEMIDLCKHCFVRVVIINYKSSLPFLQNKYDKCKAEKLFYNLHSSLQLGTRNVNSSAN